MHIELRLNGRAGNQYSAGQVRSNRAVSYERRIDNLPILQITKFLNFYQRELSTIKAFFFVKTSSDILIFSYKINVLQLWESQMMITFDTFEYSTRVQCSEMPVNIEFLAFLRSFSVAARERSKSASSSSSNASRSDRQVRGENQDAISRDYNGNDNSGSSSPHSRDDSAFDIITQQTCQSAVRDDVDSFFVRTFFLWIKRYCFRQFSFSDSASNHWLLI